METRTDSRRSCLLWWNRGIAGGTSTSRRCPGPVALIFRLLKGPLEARIAALYSPDEILMKDLAANCYGLKLWGVWQGRGNGGLVLTKDCLHFHRFVSGGDVRVPLGAITEVTVTKTHLGKATIRDLLKVRFTVDGQTDSIAWYLTDPKRRFLRQHHLLCHSPGDSVSPGVVWTWTEPVENRLL